MNSSQLSLIKEAKRILQDCACFQGPIGPTGPTGPFGKVLRVDSLYGNDTTALTNQYGLPFATIASAMGVASTSDLIYLLSGT